jgi:hypothetical protein
VKRGSRALNLGFGLHHPGVDSFFNLDDFVKMSTSAFPFFPPMAGKNQMVFNDVG